jgi:hypothetical protein
MDDLAIPVVFPAYLIAVPHPGVDLPAAINWLGIPDIKPGVDKVPQLGHAGILFIRGKDGLSKYYEYGRYDAANLGLVRKMSIPDLALKRNFDLQTALAPTLSSISKQSGQGGRIKGVLIPAPGKFEVMLKYVETRRAQNGDPHRRPYSLLSYSCIDFARETVEAASISLPTAYDPRPLGYMSTLESSFSNVSYDPRTRKVVIKKL